jgi:hypothetical protein
VAARKLNGGALEGVPVEVGGLEPAGDPGAEAGRKAIMDCVQQACGVALGEALAVQAQRSADFMTTKDCMKGMVGAEYTKTAVV